MLCFALFVTSFSISVCTNYTERSGNVTDKIGELCSWKDHSQALLTCKCMFYFHHEGPLKWLANFYFSDVVLLMKSDIDYVVKSTKRVLFKANKKDEINRTEAILSDGNTCFTWEAYIRVSDHYWVRHWGGGWGGVGWGRHSRISVMGRN